MLYCHYTLDGVVQAVDFAVRTHKTMNYSALFLDTEAIWWKERNISLIPGM